MPLTLIERDINRLRAELRDARAAKFAREAAELQRRLDFERLERRRDAALYERLVLVGAHKPQFVRLDTLRERWGVPLEQASGEEYLDALADSRFTGDVERAATTLLKDFRNGLIGPQCIEFPDEEVEQ